MWKKLHNPDQNPDSILTIHKSDSWCCGENQPPCKHSGSVDLATQPIQSIVIDEVERAFAAPATDATMLKEAIKTALQQAGYSDEQSVGTFMTNTAGTIYQVDILAEASISKMVRVGGTDHNFTAACTPITHCNYKYYGQGAFGDLSYNGVSQAIAGGPFNYSDTPATDTTTAGNIKTAVENSLNAMSAAFSTATVNVVDNLSLFEVIITAPIGTELSIGSKGFNKCKCYKDFVS